MNPFSHMFHPFSTSRFPQQTPLTINPNLNSYMRNENLGSHGNLTVPAFQSFRLPDVNNASRAAPSLEGYNLPTKRVKHSQESYSEVGGEKTSNTPQMKMSEEQMTSKAGTKSPDESFGAYNQNMRKLANNFGFGGQDGLVYGSNPSGMDESRMMAYNQYLKQFPKENALRETSNLASFAPQNNGALSLLANNLAFGDMFSKNMYASNPQYLLDFMKQSDLQAKQAAMMAQIYQSMQMGSQLIHDYQETAGNNFKLNQSMANASKNQIPPFGAFGFPGRNIRSDPSNITLQSNPEFREKIETKLSPSETYKSSNIIQQGFMGKRCMQEPKLEYLKDSVKLEAHRLEDQLTEEDQTQASSINIKEETEMLINNNLAFNKLAAIKKKKPPQQRYSDFIYEQRKPIDSRRKNKWQMKVDDLKEGGIEGQEALLNSQMQAKYKSDQIKKLNKRLVAPKIRSEELAEGEEFENSVATRPQKSKKKGNKNRHKGNNKNSNQKNPASTDENSYWNPTFIQSLIEKSHGATILSSFGKTNEELTLDENDQKVLRTQVSKDHQARICELDLSEDMFERRAPKLYWNPESFNEDELENYFAKLQATLGCQAINQDKAIKMLIKKNYIPEEVIVTIKKNEKFYSSFLGISQV